jgi:ABC-type branched-subunit amino acid transport system ATPase component
VARLGVGRTFQTPKLLADLPTIENVMLGGYAAERAGVAEIALSLPRARAESRAQRADALRYLQFVGLDGRALHKASELPHGQQRLAEVARALMARPRVLLLDEPAAGLSLGELDKLAALIGSIKKLGITIIIVEHHLELVSNVCNRVSVFDRGKVLAAGSPQEVFENQAVVSAYMGTRPLDLGAATVSP